MRALFALLLCGLLIPAHAVGAADPLSTWREGAVKSGILEFVTAVTEAQGPDFVPVAERIAVFDNDGTSWCEKPQFVPTLFQASLVRSLAAEGRIDGSRMPRGAPALSQELIDLLRDWIERGAPND